MIKKIFSVFLLLSLTSFAGFAQISTTPEVPKNYKPVPKALLPMPDSLTETAIFPVLGNYVVTNSKNDEIPIEIKKDDENKGVIWVSGLPQGTIKANLKEYPGTYKIVPQIPTLTPAGADPTRISKKTTKKAVTKPVSEGTLIFDQNTNKLFINLGGAYNEKQPAKIFPELTINELQSENAAGASKSAKKPIGGGVFYTGSKTH